ncbi:MAG TPA: hypothetical protein VKL22_05075, partial [Actinomycetota bacterium]|nr:hypothetical protein [Actinomycetota bacterium]
MDVQGTRFHLIHGRADWERCTDPATGEHLGQLWREDTHTALQFDNRSGALRLTLDTPLFRKAGPMSPLDPGIRRGSGRDRYGNWYWIDEDRVSIRRRPSGDDHSSVWWSTSELSASCAEPAGQAAGQAAGGFVTCPPAPPAGVILQGLAVTTRHYLVVGYWSTPATVGGAAEQGLLLFDLHRSADPLRLLWPGDGTFRPWDLADTGDGGVLVLDRDHATYWVLDAGFRGLGHVDPDVIPLFQAADLSRPIQRLPGASRPTGFPLRTGSIPDVVDPISIEPGPDGTVMVLDSVPGAGYSRLHLYRGSTPVWTVSLQDKVEVVDPRAPDPTPTLYSVLGHDFAYLQGPPATGPLTVPMLYVADAMGKQVIAFSLDLEQKRMVAQPDFLPLRRWEGKALVRAGEGAWYDFDDRWVPLEAFTLCEFEPEGVLT